VQGALRAQPSPLRRGDHPRRRAGARAGSRGGACRCRPDACWPGRPAVGDHLVPHPGSGSGM